MSNKQLYIIRGTGLALDGSVVTVVEMVGDYAVVAPPNSPLDHQSTMVKKACLQSLNSDRLTEYRIYIEKFNENFICVDKTNLRISNCPRDIDVETIMEYLQTNLTPILRME